MYKIDRRGGEEGAGVQNSYIRKLPEDILVPEIAGARKSLAPLDTHLEPLCNHILTTCTCFQDIINNRNYEKQSSDLQIDN